MADLLVLESWCKHLTFRYSISVGLRSPHSSLDLNVHNASTCLSTPSQIRSLKLRVLPRHVHDVDHLHDRFESRSNCRTERKEVVIIKVNRKSPRVSSLNATRSSVACSNHKVHRQSNHGDVMRCANERRYIANAHSEPYTPTDPVRPPLSTQEVSKPPYQNATITKSNLDRYMTCISRPGTATPGAIVYSSAV